jgi:putative ABC transport system permease protein
MTQLLQILRSLRRSPAFTIAAVATLALGIGANTAIFSLIDATLLDPLPYPDSDRIVQIWFTSPTGADTNQSIPALNILAQQSQVFNDVTAYDFGGPGVNLTGRDQPEQVQAIHVSAPYFHLFGARFEFGRSFTADEDRPDGGRVAVISHALWLRRFHADPNLVGSTISLGGQPYLVTGIVSGDFQPDPPAQIWFPLQADPLSNSAAAYVRSAARLRPGVTIDRANAALKLAWAEYRRKFPRVTPKAGFEARPLRETNAGNIRTPLMILFATVVLVLLIACSNVANLLLARGAARQREIAIRAALGASRGQLIVQLLTEALFLSTAGAFCGLIVGRLALKALLALNPEFVPTVSLDARVLLFTAAFSVGAALLFGLLPALRTSRASLSDRTSTGTLRAKSILVVVQVALSVVLVIGAGLMIRTFAALRHVAPGFDPDRILTMQMSLQGTRFTDTAAVASLVDRAVDRLQQLPGVESAASSWMLPVESAFGSSFIIEGRPLGDSPVHGGALMRPVSPEYAAVFRLPVVRGRFFTARDSAASASVAVISDAMAKKFWPNGDPLGERITIDKYLGPDFYAPPREIVGIAGDVRDLGINQQPAPLIYIPEAQAPTGMTRIDAGVLPMTWSVRTASPPYSLRGAIRHALEDASGGLAVSRTRSMREVIGHSTARSDFDTVLLAVFAAASLLLAAVGIYGLVVFAVQQRRLEIGIRLALGATPHQVRNMVVSEGVRLALAGVLAGAAASAVLARYMKTLLYGVQPIDPTVMAISCLTLGAVAAVASYLPAYRASLLDPANALRSA